MKIFFVLVLILSLQVLGATNCKNVSSPIVLHKISVQTVDPKDTEILSALRAHKLTNFPGQPKSDVAYTLGGETFTASKILTSGEYLTGVILDTNKRVTVKDYQWNRGENDWTPYFWREIILTRWLAQKGIPVSEILAVDFEKTLIAKPFYPGIGLDINNFGQDAKGIVKYANTSELMEDLTRVLRRNFTRAYVMEVQKAINDLTRKLTEIYMNPDQMRAELKKVYQDLKKEYPKAQMPEDLILMKLDWAGEGNIHIVVEEGQLSLIVLDP